ncbi:MAG: 3-hydroxyacyl-CoA dehydrogenase [Planctomycetaceae bacterium]|jgi:3-hydroxyacyl-CoA dehydrogenase/enoyl-CoA hydratase/3-hydroxybutyryl-CoA epimerase/enoyl-CoA isomerase|nr:3-hydroxyacyl-CoA dehydrogenase [Planctomycetaceae bacterium]
MNMSSPTAILGAGMMGTAIAAAHLRCGQPVVLYDTADAALQSAPNRIADELRLQGLSCPNALLTCTGHLDDIASCPIIIETIPEKLKAKQKLYQKLTADRNPEGFLFSNTSTISISLLAQDLQPDWQSRFCGFHFFHPVRQRSLVEIVAGKQTDAATLESAKQHASRIDKRFILVGDSPGFLVNRLLNPYLSSALALLEQKVDLQRIERVAMQFGMQMGPFRIMDEIGLDVVLHAGWVLHKAFPDRTPQSSLLLQLIEQGKLGRKTGQGFMFYTQQASWEGEGIPDPQFASPVEAVSDSEIVRRLFVPMYEEALRCAEDGVISDLSLADRASVEALGFPVEKGGIVTWGAVNGDSIRR